MGATLTQKQPNMLVVQRLAELEEIVTEMRSNQTQVLNYGTITLDGNNERILVTDTINNRILIDGRNADMKISLPGFDVLTATGNQLLFSTQFGSPGFYMYPIVSSPFFQIFAGDYGTTYLPAGPNNGSAGQYTYMTIEFNASDFPQAKIYFEAVLGGPAGLQGCVRLYNITDASVISGSEICFTSTGGESSSTLRVGPLMLPAGTKFYGIQIKQASSGASTVAIAIGRLVVFTK